jgi:lipoprotein-releasing system permease protein
LLQDQFHLIRLNEVDYYLAYAPIRLELWPLLAINAGALLLTLLFLLLPSLAVSNIAPVRAIRFK